MLIREKVEYENGAQAVFITDRYGSPGAQKNAFVLVSGGEEDDVGLWAAKVLPLFGKSVKRSIESQ